MTLQQRVRRASKMASLPTVTEVLTGITPTTGRPRLLDYRTVLALCFFHTMSNPQTMTVAQVCRSARELSANQLGDLGVPRGLWITYKRVYSGVRDVGDRIQEGVRPRHNHLIQRNSWSGVDEPCPADCPACVFLSLDEITTRLVQSGLPPGTPRTSGVAADGTDHETSAVPARGRFTGPTGKEQASADPDTRWAKRTATDRRPHELYVGYEMHVATYVPPVGGEPVPQLCAGLALRPGVQDRVGAAVALVDSIQGFGEIDEVLLDRGYTTAQPENLVRPLRDLGVRITMDLHTSQRGTRPGPIPGTVFVDGHLYSSAIPESLRTLIPPGFDSTADDSARTHELFDKRRAYQFVAHSKVSPLGSQRFKGPALSGRVRCPNVPATMRLGHHLPTTTCEPGTDCGCGKTVTVPITMFERDRQELPWQSTAWALSYNRRSLIEGYNAQIRYLNLNVNRGFIRMFGLGVTALLLAITLAGRNAEHLHDWYTTRHLPEPWQVHLGEPVDDRPLDHYTRTRGTGRNRRGPPHWRPEPVDNREHPPHR